MEDVEVSVPKRFRWLSLTVIAALVGVVVHFCVFLLVAIPVGDPKNQPSKVPFAAYIPEQDYSDRILREQALLFDSEPLFMPTRWNYASSLQHIARLRDEAELFRDFAPVLQLQAEQLSFQDVVDPGLRISLESAIRRDSWPSFSQLGKVFEGKPVQPLAPREAQVKVDPLDLGGEGMEFSLPGSLSVSAPGAIWNPMKFTVLIDPRSMGGAPMQITTSGFPDWDRAVGEFLGSGRFRNRLRPGYYRVIVGP